MTAKLWTVSDGMAELPAVVRKKLGLTLLSEKADGDDRIYRVMAGQQLAPASALPRAP